MTLSPASSRSGAGTGGGTTLVQTIGPVGAGVTSFDFTGISGGSTHLMIIGQCRTVVAATTDTLSVTVNGDSTANYNEITVGTSGLSTALNGSAVGTNGLTLLAVGDTGTVGWATNFVIFVPNYSGAVFTKELHGSYSQFFGALTADAKMEYRSATWGTVGTAITRVTVTPGNALKPGSLASLYTYQ